MLCFILGEIKHSKKKEKHLALLVNLICLAELLFYSIYIIQTVVKCITLHIFREMVQVRTCMSDKK